MSQRRILITAALPYANGHIHIGHLVEYIQTDIWVRYQKLRGRRCIYLCADDTHGTAIMIRARQEGRPETAVIADMREAHVRIIRTQGCRQAAHVFRDRSRSCAPSFHVAGAAGPRHRDHLLHQHG